MAKQREYEEVNEMLENQFKFSIAPDQFGGFKKFIATVYNLGKEYKACEELHEN